VSVRTGRRGEDEHFRVVGGGRLAGEVSVPGAKNSALKLMAAALLVEGRTVLSGMPDILDITTMGEILGRLGCGVEWSPGAGEWAVTVPAAPGVEAPYELVRQIRGSICLLGSLTARLGEARIPLPGGDAIGSRPVDLHVAGLQKLGAEVEIEHGLLIARAPAGLTGAGIWLDFPSVTATENLLLAASLAKGTTTLDNCAREPEVVDLCEMLTAMGARIDGAGTSTITVEGVEGLSPVSHQVVPDRIVAGTWAVAAALTGGDIVVRRGRVDHLRVALEKFARAGLEIDERADGFRATMGRRPRCVDVVTLPYPGFPTDLQPLAILLNALGEGSALVTENLFEGRFAFVDELARLGADVRTDGHHCVVHGRPRLSGAPVHASDVRAGVALTLAGLVAEGVTEVHQVHHVDRGYAGFVEHLQSLGADVRRVP